MRDDSNNWDAPDTNIKVLADVDVEVMQVFFNRQTMISGTDVLDRTLLPLVEWPDKVNSDSYALVLRRDRILEVNGDHRPDGWNASAGIAVSNMTDGYEVFRLSGLRALDLLKRGAFIDASKPSRSVARQLFGLPVFLYRCEKPDSYLVHVPSAHAQTLRHSLCRYWASMPA